MGVMASWRSRRTICSPSMSGRPRSSRTTSGRLRFPPFERRAPVGRLHDPVAACAEVPNEGRPRLLVVLDDEHRRERSRWVGRAHPGAWRGTCGGAGAGLRSRSMARPPSSLRRADTRPPIASTRPRTTARPIPVPDRERRGRAGDPVELLEQPWECRVRDARAGSPRRSVGRSRPPRRPGRRARIVASGGVYFIALSSDVRHRLVEEDRVDGDRGRPDVHVERAAAQACAGASDGGAQQVVELEGVALGAERAGLDPAQVEEVRDEPVEVLDLPVDGVGARVRDRRRACETPGRSVPAAARIVASGVRRSCDTDWSRADLSASLWRAISAACASAASRSWAIAWPIWSAAAESSRVSVRSGSAAPAGRERPDRAERPAAGLDPDAVEPSRRRPGRRVRLGAWTRTQRAGSSPGIRRSTRCRPAVDGRGPDAVSATTRSAALVRAQADPDALHARVRPGATSAIEGRTATVESRVARARLTRKSDGPPARGPRPSRSGRAGGPPAARRRCRRTAAARGSATRRGRRR